MRKYVVLCFMVTSNFAFSDSIQKWTDASGQTHYGDYSPTIATSRQTVDVHQSFDKESYKAAIKRNKTLYKDVKQIEKRERKKTKAAEKRLNRYFKSLDKIDRAKEKAKINKRRARESKRNRASIRVIRSKAKNITVEKSNIPTGMN